MSHLLFTGFRTTCKSLFALWCVLFLTGCIASTQLGKNPSDKIQLESIDLKVAASSINVLIKGDGKMKYSAVKQDFPLGILVYLHDVVIGDKYVDPAVEGIPEITSLTASYADQARKNAVIKILIAKDLTFDVKEDGKILKLVLYNSSSYEMSESTFHESNIFSETESQTSGLSPAGSGIEPQKKDKSKGDNFSSYGAYGRKAEVTGLDFKAGDDGESRIVIKTSSPVKYDMHRNEFNNELQLSLYNTDIPKYHQRQLITTYFNSAVDKIIPVGRTSKESPSRIHIALRETVPYHILQEQNRLTVFFEPSSVKPKRLEGDEMALSGGSSAGPGNTVYSINGNENLKKNAPGTNASRELLPGINDLDRRDKNSQTKQLPVQLGSSEQEAGSDNDLRDEPQNKSASADSFTEEKGTDFFDDHPVYTGEEISLDFYETDIKNVFRILQTVSGENFAVDKDVTGTVTLTLEKPAPWDEILDLILKMNSLGKIKEGSIVRIATLQTIKKEEDQKAALFASRVQAIEQKKQQEPMYTEYIPINYSNAETDIMPHIEKLLTQPRSGGISGDKGGTISVDKRTNMIILTDTRKKIEEAKQLIYTLDKVTPQIMISARIVEVTKDFSRELGVEWKLNSDDVYRDDLGGLYSFDIAMNHSITSTTSGIGYSFSRLAGTPLVLDAKLTASELTGDTKIISSPRILTLDNKTAKIDQGLEYGYQSGVDENGNPVIEFKPVKLSLEVKPQVTPDKRVAMTVKITKNEVSGTVAGIPSLSTSEANTELLVNDGNTIVIGGIVKSTVSESRSGFPILSSIPYLGQLFRSDTSADKKNELLIFITPTIVQLDQKDNKL